MHSSFRELSTDRRGRVAREWIPAVLVAYFVLLGGTEAGVTSTAVRALNVVIGGVLTLAWIRRLPRDNDRLDRVVLVALLAFLVACALSDLPRHSFDAALNAMAYAAAFYLARRELAAEPARRNLVWVLAGIAVTFTVVVAFIWLRTWLDWGRLSGFRAWPPVDLPLPVLVYRHPHVVGMLVVLLAPAIVLAARLWRNPLARATVVPALALVALVAFMSGSRTTWAATVLAGITTAFLWVIHRSRPGRIAIRPRTVTAGVVVSGVLVVIVAVASLTAPDELIARLTNLGTLGERGRIWAAAFDVWRADPIGGAGPGMFPIAVGDTGLFERMPFMPRHADNAAVQLLAEAGSLGVIGAGALVVTGVAVLRRASTGDALPEAWGVAFFAFASLADNPSDTANLVALLLVWGALGSRTRVSAGMPRRPAGCREPSRMLRVATPLAAAAAAAAFVSVTLASAAFDSARHSVRSGDYAGARRVLSVAVALDPALALYHRDRGALSLALGDAAAARRDLEHAARRNPGDDAVLRGLAVLASLEGRHADALRSAQRAVDLQRSDVTNTVVLGWVASRGRAGPIADAALVEAIQQAPWITGSEYWGAHFPADERLTELFDQALDEWVNGSGTTVIGDIEPTWLVSLAGAEAYADRAATGTSISRTSRFLAAVLACEPIDVERHVEEALATDGHRSGYWAARIIAQRLTGRGDLGVTLALTQLRASFIAYLAVYPPEPMYPFSETGGQDMRLYRREALPPVDLGVGLPSADGGLAAWLQDPAAAAERGAPGSPISDCS